MQDDGVKGISGPYETWRGQLSFSWQSATEAQGVSQSNIHETCRREHHDIVALQYFYQVRPTEHERIDARAALVECLRVNGVDTSDDPTSDEFRALALSGDAAFRSCRAAVVEDFDFSEGWLP
jgi:hypothetical protein